jgi:hypothetical protein
MSYYTVYLEGEDAERLRELAHAERRRPRSQAEILLEDAIRRAGTDGGGSLIALIRAFEAESQKCFRRAESASTGLVQERVGPGHCDWQSARFLYWAPPGTPGTLRATRLYGSRCSGRRTAASSSAGTAPSTGRGRHPWGRAHATVWRSGWPPANEPCTSRTATGSSAGRGSRPAQAVHERHQRDLGPMLGAPSPGRASQPGRDPSTARVLRRATVASVLVLAVAVPVSGQDGGLVADPSSADVWATSRL